MPSKSKQQQKFMGMVHALKKGDIEPSSVSKSVKDAAKSMSKKDTKDFASTKHKNLPLKVKQEILNKLKEYANKMGRDHLGGDDYTSKKKGGLRDFDGYDNVDYNKNMPMDEKMDKRQVGESVNEDKFYNTRVQYTDPKSKKKFVGDVVRKDGDEYKVNLGKDGRFEKYILAKAKDLKIVSKSKKRTYESVNEGISVFDERHFGKKGIIIMIDDNGKKVSAIFKDKKNADKFNRNKPSDIKKLLQLAKKTKYPKAIDESVNEGKKRFKRQDGIGKAKYTISFHDGRKKHKDGSDFFDIKIFKNKKDLSNFVGTLVKKGYKLTNESVNEVGKGSNWAEKYVNDTNLYKKLNWYIKMGKGAEKKIKGKEFVIMSDGSALIWNTKTSDWELYKPKRIDKKTGKPTYESVNEILVIVDKFDKRKQDYDKVYYQDGGKRPGDGDINKAQKEFAKLSKKHKGLTLISVDRNSKMYDVNESVNERINPKFYDARVQYIDPKSKKKFVGDVVRYDNGEYKVNLGKDGRFEKYILAKEKDLKIVSKSKKKTFESVNEGKYNYKADALTAYFKGKIDAKELDKIARDDFKSGIATKKELSNFLSNKFTQDVMSDTYGIPAGTLIKRVRGLMKFAEGKDDGVPQGYNPMVEDKKQIKDLVKKVKHEKLFYDVLDTMEKKYGKRKYRIWLEKSLKDFGINPKHYDYRTNAAAEEKLFQLGK